MIEDSKKSTINIYIRFVFDRIESRKIGKKKDKSSKNIENFE